MLRRDDVSVGHAAVRVHPVAHPHGADRLADLRDDADESLAELLREAGHRRVSAPVQPEIGVPAVGRVGGVEPEVAELRAVLHRAELCGDPYLAGRERRVLVLAQDGVTGAVGDQFKRHPASTCYHAVSRQK